MSLNRRILATTAGWAVAAAAAFTIAASPVAEAGNPLCPANQVCLYANAGYVGLLGYRGGGQGLVNVSSGANDQTSSYENKSNDSSAWYRDANGQGACYNMPNGTENSYAWGAPQNDSLTSWRTNGSC